MKIPARLSFLLFYFLFFASSLLSQKDFSDIDQLLEAKKDVLGKDFIAMVWWQRDASNPEMDTLIYKKQTNQQFKTTVQAPIASASKWLTAALVMTFVDEGKLSLDDPVVKYVPEFGKYFKNYITVRHCLSQTTGIESEPIKILKLLERKKFATLEEEVNSFAAKKISDNPGEEFYYGNIGLNIVGRVLEVVGKRRFDQLMTQRLGRKLAMRRTTFSNIAVAPSILPAGPNHLLTIT
ncbi:MAG: beta-lactamase family protein [Bacteroidia bacterium]|nr:beta-lactamase family protein [Bacteroidia bacterium]